MPRKSDAPIAFVPNDDPVAAVMAALVPVHAALTPEWLADATVAAAERALKVPCALLYVEEEDGGLRRLQPASEQRRRSMSAVQDALGADVLPERLDPQSLPALAEALDAGSPLLLPLESFFAPLLPVGAAARAAALDIDTACMTPLETAGERLGALIALGDSTMNPHHLRLLAEHVACAAVNLRTASAAREVDAEPDVVRTVFDARKLEAELQRETQRAIRYKREVSICIIEATNLRLLRERFGRQLTDELLERLGDELARQSREIDLIGSFKESGFTMVLTEASAAGAETAARRLRNHVDGMAFDGAETVPGLELHLAVGWATCPQDGVTAEVLFSAAERRMYEQAA